MAVHYKTRGFVFKKEDRHEADKVFSVFTQDFGRVEIFAKAIRRIASKLKGGIEIFSLSELEFIQGKNRKTLVDAILIEKFNTILETPEKIEIAKEVCSLLDDSIKGPQSDEKILSITVDFFQKLNSAPAHYPIAYAYFFWNFISALGYRPEFSICVACRQVLRPEVLYFSNKEGGIVCENCFAIKKEGTLIHTDMVKILRIILKKDWQTFLKLKMGKNHQEGLEKISKDYRRYLFS